MEGLRIEQRNGAVIVTIGGEITMENTPELKQEVEQAIKGDYEHLILELSDVSFIDSSGIGFLVSMSTRVGNAGKSFELLKPSPQVTKTLELVQLIKYFRILRSDDELALQLS